MSDEHQSSAAAAKEIARTFLRLYYKILNDYPSYSHKFYDHDSYLKVLDSVDKKEPPVREATTLNGIRNLLVAVYNDFSVMPSHCGMKSLEDGSIELHVTGTMFSTDFTTDKHYEQTVKLAQINSGGFYVQSDYLQISKSPPVHSITFHDSSRKESRLSPKMA